MNTDSEGIQGLGDIIHTVDTTEEAVVNAGLGEIENLAIA